MSSQFPQYHFQLYTSYPEENQIQRKGKCVKVCPEVHYNMNKQFVIEPGQSIIAILCNKDISYTPHVIFDTPIPLKN